MGVVYENIPENLWRAACGDAKLRRVGKPVPGDIREIPNRYERWVYRDGQDPG